MVNIEQLLLVNTGISSIVLLLLIFLSTISAKKNSKQVNKKHLTADLQKIKEQISEKD